MRGSRASHRTGALRPAMLLGSAIFHAALLVFLARYLAQTPTYGETPAMQVSLMPPRDRAKPNVPAPAPPDRSDRRATGGTAPRILSSPAPAGAAAPLLSGDAPAGADDGARTRQALRDLGGCERAGLTRDERDSCEARRWAGRAPVAPRLNLDPSGRYAVNPEAFLSRRPTDGCRLRATGDVDPLGDDANARAGITCVKPF